MSPELKTKLSRAANVGSFDLDLSIEFLNYAKSKGFELDEKHKLSVYNSLKKHEDYKTKDEKHSAYMRLIARDLMSKMIANKTIKKLL